MPRNETVSLDTEYDPDDYDVAQREAEAERDYPDDPPPRRRSNGKRPAKRASAGTIPANAPEPQDHKPKKSAPQREAEGIDTIEILFDGEKYEIPADPADWPIEASEAMEYNRVITAVRLMLGPKQWQRVLRKKYRNRKFRELFDLISNEGGFGNSGN